MFSTVFDVGGIVGSPALGLVLDRYYQGNPLKGVTIAMLAGNKGVTIAMLAGNKGVTIAMLVGNKGVNTYHGDK